MINYCENEIFLIDNLRSKSVNGITKKYDWNIITKKYLNIFYDLLKK